MGLCYFGLRAIQKKITMSLWLICIAIEPIVFYGTDGPIPVERAIKIRLKKQLEAEYPTIKISLFEDIYAHYLAFYFITVLEIAQRPTQRQKYKFTRCLLGLTSTN